MKVTKIEKSGAKGFGLYKKGSKIEALYKKLITTEKINDVAQETVAHISYLNFSLFTVSVLSTWNPTPGDYLTKDDENGKPYFFKLTKTGLSLGKLNLLWNFERTQKEKN